MGWLVADTLFSVSTHCSVSPGSYAENATSAGVASNTGTGAGAGTAADADTRRGALFFASRCLVGATAVWRNRKYELHSCPAKHRPAARRCWAWCSGRIARTLAMHVEGMWLPRAGARRREAVMAAQPACIAPAPQAAPDAAAPRPGTPTAARALLKLSGTSQAGRPHRRGAQARGGGRCRARQRRARPRRPAAHMLR